MPRGGRVGAIAIRLAEEGANIIAVDICRQLQSVGYPMSISADLEQTVKEVEGLGRRIVVRQSDVREVDQLHRVFNEGVEELGPVAIVLANAGIGPGGMASDPQQWDEVMGVNLTGVWNTGRVAIPSTVKNRQGGDRAHEFHGRPTGATIDVAGMLAYTAAKHGVIGVTRSWANSLASYFIRVNSVAPTTVRTPIARDGNVAEIIEHVPKLAGSLINAIPVEAVDAIDVSNAVLWLVSEEACYVTGSAVDAGNVNRRWQAPPTALTRVSHVRAPFASDPSRRRFSVTARLCRLRRTELMDLP